MTPSETADWLSNRAEEALRTHDNIDFVNMHSAAATIRAQAEALKIATEALSSTKDRVMTWPVGEQEHCMCGSRVKDHDIGSGHSPVSMGDHAIDGITKAINEALARIEEV